MPSEYNKKSALVVIAHEFGIKAEDLQAEAEKLTERDGRELASAIARMNGMPAEECGWELVDY